MKDGKAIVLLALVSAVVFANSFYNDFVYDDIPFIVNNPAIKNFSNIIDIFTSRKAFSPKGDSLIYRPLSTLGYTFDYFLWGFNPFMFHLASFLWHLAVVCILYVTLKEILKDKTLSLISSLLFTAHPIQTESVAWLSQRSNLISLFFFMLSLYLWIRGNLFGSVASYLMALLGKEMAVTLPLILLLYDVFWRRHCKWKRYLPFFVVAVLYVALRTAVLGRISGQDAYAGGSIYTAILTAVKASLFYAKLLVFPVKLCIDHKFSPAISFFDPAVMGAIIFVIAAIWVAIFLFGKGRGKKDFSYSGFL